MGAFQVEPSVLSPRTHVRRPDWDPREEILYEVADETVRQDEKWGEQNHPDLLPEEYSHRTYHFTAEAWKRTNDARVAKANADGALPDRNCAWDGILLEEVYEALAESDPAKLRAELVQVAAVAVQWVAAIDRRG